LLCAAFAVGSVCLLLIGDSRMLDFWDKNGDKIAFMETDVFSSKSFVETRTFRQTAASKVDALSYAYSEYADESGVKPDAGDA